MSRPMADHHDPKAIDESTDTYDTVDWLLKNVAGNNGRAGFVGTSYPGFLAMAAGIDPHPAVKAISPQAPMIDVWMGDDFFHNGAFRQTYGYDYVFGMESNKEQTSVSYGKDKDGNPRDGFDYFLERGSFGEDVKHSGVKAPFPTWKLFLDHPGYDTVWSSRGVEHHLNTVAVPTLSVGGYYDQEDMWGPQAEYSSLEPHDDQHQNFLVLGPWRHGSLVLLIAPPRQPPIRRVDRQGISLPDRGQLLRALSEGRAGLRPRRHRKLPDRLQHMEALRAFPAKRIRAHHAAPCRAKANSAGTTLRHRRATT